jgi:uncharacterized protein (TIGR03437 family)
MDSSVLRRHGSTIFAVLIALTAGSGALQAAGAALLLTATPSTATLACNTATGTPTTTVVITPKTALTGLSTLAVTYATPPTGVTVTPASGTLSATTTSLSFVVGLAGNCIGVTAGTATLQFEQGVGPTNDATVALTIATPVTTASALSPSSSSVNITCTTSGPTFFNQNVTVSSPITGGTPFTVTTASGGPLPSWLTTISGATAGVPGGTPGAATLDIVGQTSCATQSTTLHLVTTAPSLGIPDKLITVNETIVAASTLGWNLTATGGVCPSEGTTASISYVKGSGIAGKVGVTLCSTVSAFFSIDTTTLPVWLTVDSTSGNLTSTTSKSINFSTTSYADSLVPGTYTLTGASSGIRVNIAGDAPVYIPLTLQITNPTPKLTVAEGQTRNLTWTIGGAYPTPVITAVSTDTPIPFTVSTAGPLVPLVCANCTPTSTPAATTSGLAYSFGTPVDVTFSSAAFAAASPGQVLTGTVTLTSGTPATNLVVTFNITVQSALATISSISLASLPTATTGTQFTGLVLSGSGFVVSTNPLLKTTVGIVPSGSGTMVVDTNITWTVPDPSHIDLVITANTSDTLLPFASGGSVTLGVCNPTCIGNVPTGTATFTIGSTPSISAITTSSTFGQTTNVTLYDMISIFGANFCSSGSTGCASSQILYGTADPVLLTYPTTLNVDATLAATPLPATTPCTGTQRCVSVSFYTHGSVPPAGILANAPLLFATSGQINAVIPSGVGTIGTTVDMYVNFGYGAAGSSTLHSSTAYPVTIVAKDPGLFTTTADGSGSGAILNSSYTLVGSSNPAGLRTGSDSDIIQIYMTGLGAPDSTGAGSSGVSAWPADCETLAGYQTLFNTYTGGSATTLDGAVITPSAILSGSGRLVPCFLSTDTLAVTVGGQAGTVQYAGWAPGTIAGLYQLNVLMPVSTATYTTTTNSVAATLTGPAEVPVSVEATVSGSHYYSQNNVYVWVSPKLKVPAPTLSGTLNVSYSSTVAASESPTSSSISSYVITAGLLPPGTTLNAATGAITGTPTQAGSFTATITASDSATPPVTGSVTFTIVIADVLTISHTSAGPFTETYGTASGTLTQVTASGGTAPYTYAVAVVGGSTPVGMSAAGGYLSTSPLTPVGVYTATVTATDANGITGSANFTITVNLAITLSSTSSTIAASAASSTLATITTAAGGSGAIGTITYTLDATTIMDEPWITINASTGALGQNGSSVSTGSPFTIHVIATDSGTATGSNSAIVTTLTYTLTVT